jgi:hypothetical protein
MDVVVSRLSEIAVVMVDGFSLFSMVRLVAIDLDSPYSLFSVSLTPRFSSKETRINIIAICGIGYNFGMPTIVVKKTFIDRLE